MKELEDKTIVVAGGTGNVGSYIVRELLEHRAHVVVPSRSEERIKDFLAFIEKSNGSINKRLHVFKGNLSDEDNAPQLMDRITTEVGKPDATISSLGYFIPSPSLLITDSGNLNRVMDGYLIAQFNVARTFLPVYRENGGTFMFINGPLAFDPWNGTGLVSIATAAQHMLFKSFAKELEGTKAKIVELVNYAYIRNRQTQPSSTITGEVVGTYCAWLLSGKSGDQHGKSIHLRSPEQLEAIGNNKTERG